MPSTTTASSERKGLEQSARFDPKFFFLGGGLFFSHFGLKVDDFNNRAKKRSKYQTRHDLSKPSGPPSIYDGPSSVSLVSSGGGSGGGGNSGSSSKRFSSGGVGSSGLPSAPAVDPASLRSVELLGFSERALAAELALSPDQFIVVKEAMLREYFRVGQRLSKADAKSIAPIDQLSAGAIYEFLVESRWIIDKE